MTSSAQHLPQTDLWHATPAARAGSVAVVVFWAALATVALVSDHAALAATLGILTAAFGMLAWRLAFVPEIVLEPDRVVARNPFSTQAAEYTQIDSASVRYDGVTLRLRDDSRVRLYAVQKSDLLRRMGRRTRADDLVDTLLTRSGSLH